MYEKDNNDLRITFDRNITARTDRLSLTEPYGGTKLLPDGIVLMEVKAERALPLWLVRELSRVKALPGSFSKYGSAYQQLVLYAANEREVHCA
jgi:hypothetical protein